MNFHLEESGGNPLAVSHHRIDKDTGEEIGEIHMKQPEKVDIGGGKQKYTGRKFPSHYHDYANLLGKGGSHHYWWK